MSGTQGARCCCGGAAAFSRETAVAVATPALAHTSSSAPPEPCASPLSTASPAPGLRSAWDLHTAKTQSNSHVLSYELQEKHQAEFIN